MSKLINELNAANNSYSIDNVLYSINSSLNCNDNIKKKFDHYNSSSASQLLTNTHSMPPQPLPLNNRHLAKYLSKSSSRIDQDQKVNDSAKKKDYKESIEKSLFFVKI